MEMFIIKKPLITEKAVDAGHMNKYIFQVAPKASSAEIRKAVKEIYGVQVIKINIINRRPKFGVFRGRSNALRSKGYKKAIVTLKEGQSIDVIAH